MHKLDSDHVKKVIDLRIGSGDWLGCVLVILIIVLGIELAVLAMLYKQKREYNQHRRKSNERPSETNQQTCLPLQSPARNLGKLGSGNKNLGMLGRNQRSRGIAVRILGEARNLLAMPLNFVLKLCGCHTIKDVAKQPNVAS